MIAYKQKRILLLAIPFFLFSSAHAYIISSIVKMALSPCVIDLVKTKENSLIKNGQLQSSFQNVRKFIKENNNLSLKTLKTIAAQTYAIFSTELAEKPILVQFFTSGTDKKTLVLLFATNAAVDTTATLVCDKKTKQSPLSIFAENFASELSDHIICNEISPYMAAQLCKQVIQEGDALTLPIKFFGKVLGCVANNYVLCPLARKLVVKPIINNLFKAESE